MAATEQHRFVFIGGLHRSGTSLVARLLAEHPDVSTFRNTGVPEDEGEHLQNVYVDSNDIGGVGRFAFSPRAHMTEQSSLAVPDTYERLMHQWAPHWDLTAPVLLEKSPPNLLKMRFLDRVFPQAHFIMVMRHPVAVSAAHLKWRRKVLRWFAPHSLLRHWVVAFERFAADVPHVARVTVIRYEDLVADPVTEIRRLQAFIGLSEHEVKTTVSGDQNKRYLAQWRSHPGNLPKQAYRDWIANRYRDRVARFGYSFEDPEPVEARDVVLRRLGVPDHSAAMGAAPTVVGQSEQDD
jgi:hypothetical protein